MSLLINVTAAAPPRGPGSQTPNAFAAQSMRATFAWGSSPSTATVVYIGATPVTVGALVTITVGAHLFVGLCRSDTAVASSRGDTRELVFVDLRELLQWDWVFCAFNMPVRRMVNGVWKKRYWHIYPADFDTYTKTWTDQPLLAWEILSAIFSAPTVGSPWAWNLTGNGLFPGGLMNQPVFSVNFLNGVRLDAALNEISERGKLVFTHDPVPGNAYRLVWTRKGYGQVPFRNPALSGGGINFPDDSDEQRSGLALSGHATNIRVLGERNRYQVLEVPLTPNWNSHWEQFVAGDALFLDIFQNERDPLSGNLYTSFADDPEQWKGAYAAKVRALEITVGEYVAMRNARSSGTGDQFIDFRKFAGRCRMDMPAALYIQSLVFRAYVPDVSGITNVNGKLIPLESATIVDAMPCRVVYDPTNGQMQSIPGELVDGNGLAIVKGASFGQDLFRLVDPERITATFFNATARPWTQVPFQIDDSGEGQRFIIFESPVFTSSDLLTTIDGMQVLNAAPTLASAVARAALTFELEPFSYWKGTYPNVSRDQVEYISGLCEEFTGFAGSYQKILFANGRTASQQADEIATNLLLAQYIYATGGYRLNWNPRRMSFAQFGTFLSSVIDRVDVEVSPTGLFEIVDFTTERARDHFEPERDLERRTLQNTLFPGQAELKAVALDYKRFAAGIKSTPRDARNLFINFLRGEFDETTVPVRFDPSTVPGSPPTVAAGTPIVKPPTEEATGGSTANTKTLATHPDAVDPNVDTLFVGVTVRHGENANNPFYVKSTGETYARVQGPIDENDVIGLAGSDFTYLIKDGTPAVGVALQKITSGVKLIKVRLGMGGSGGSRMHPFRIYRSPANPGGDPDNEAWRTVRVRSGKVIIASMGDDDPAKTDGASDPDSSEVPAYDADNIEIIVPSGEGQYWIWLRLTWDSGGSRFTSEVRHGSDPTANGWDSYPAFDGRHIPLGYVDTDTHSSEERTMIRQWIRTDIIWPSVPRVTCDVTGAVSGEAMLPQFSEDT